MLYPKIGFIGLGLIGGSIAKIIKEKYPETEMIAIASRESTIQAAYADGIITNDTMLDLEAFADCDLLFLCGPVRVNVDYLTRLANILPAHCIITDVGSVKGDITKAVADLGLTSRFIGGHPMAGSEAIGYDHSSPYLLENAYYILTVTDDFSSERLADFSAFITSLGALTLIMSPEKHDFATACISHLPHVIAASLVNFVAENDFVDETMKTIAAGGFRDITRIASSSPVMWQHICATNRDEILKAAALYQKSLQDFITSITDQKDDAVIRLFSSAKDYRDDLPLKKQGVLPSSYEFIWILQMKPVPLPRSRQHWQPTASVSRILVLCTTENLKKVSCVSSYTIRLPWMQQNLFSASITRFTNPRLSEVRKWKSKKQIISKVRSTFPVINPYPTAVSCSVPVPMARPN